MWPCTLLIGQGHVPHYIHVFFFACHVTSMYVDQILPLDYVMIRTCTYHATKVIDTGHDMVLKIFFYSGLTRIHVIVMNIFLFEVITHHTFAFVHVKK